MFGALGKLVNKAVGDFKSAFDRLANEEELDAVVAATVLIAAADGNISDTEKQTALSAVMGHESLKAFASQTIRDKFESDVKLVNADMTLASEVLYGKISKIKEMTARIRVIGVANEVANADGEFSAAEKKVVDQIRKVTAS